MALTHVYPQLRQLLFKHKYALLDPHTNDFTVRKALYCRIYCWVGSPFTLIPSKSLEGQYIQMHLSFLHSDIKLKRNCRFGINLVIEHFKSNIFWNMWYIYMVNQKKQSLADVSAVSIWWAKSLIWSIAICANLTELDFSHQNKETLNGFGRRTK